MQSLNFDSKTIFCLTSLPKDINQHLLKLRQTYSMYLRDDRFIGIYFETAASVLKFVKQSKGFISIMNTNSNVCQLLLGFVSKGGFIEKNDYFMAYIFSSIFSFNLFFSYG